MGEDDGVRVRGRMGEGRVRVGVHLGDKEGGERSGGCDGMRRGWHVLAR